jgi:low temperature requirement protein LtrA
VPKIQVLRDRGANRSAHVTNMELFFDLVYVFAFTQISEHLYAAHSWKGALEVLVLFAALWWAWNYTSWATGWIDPDRAPVVLLLALLMLASLVMSAAIVNAFTTRGVAFSAAYVASQVGRGAFMVWAFARGDTMRRNYAQLTAWSAIAGCFWLAGGFVDSVDLRLELWAAGAVLDTSAPLHGFWLPGFGSTPMRDWTLAGAHLAERCQLLLMIGFGETFLRIGESFAESHESGHVVLAFIVGCVMDFAFWSLYFFHHAGPSEERIGAASDEAARLGRSAYAYAHALMIGAIIVVAVAIDLTIQKPTGDVYGPFAAISIGGPALYLLGLALSKRSLDRGSPWPPLLGVLALLALGTLAAVIGDRLLVLVAVTVVALALALWAAVAPSSAGPAAAAA